MQQAFQYFNGYQTGGRITNINDELYLTIGDYNDWKAPQQHNRNVGKIVLINSVSGKSKIISKGHRNPQGLYVYSKEKRLLIATEHGPKGGDEINLIYIDKPLNQNNFGWPIASYGNHYDAVPINSFTRKYAPLKKNHTLNNFIEPIFYFKESIGISEIIKKNNSTDNKYIVTSLKNKRIYIIDINKIDKKTKIIKEINIDERIRDIIFDKENKVYYLYLESTPLLMKLTLNK